MTKALCKSHVLNQWDTSQDNVFSDAPPTVVGGGFFDTKAVLLLHNSAVLRIAFIIASYAESLSRNISWQIFTVFLICHALSYHPHSSSCRARCVIAISVPVLRLRHSIIPVLPCLLCPLWKSDSPNAIGMHGQNPIFNDSFIQQPGGKGCFRKCCDMGCRSNILAIMQHMKRAATVFWSWRRALGGALFSKINESSSGMMRCASC